MGHHHHHPPTEWEKLIYFVALRREARHLRFGGIVGGVGRIVGSFIPVFYTIRCAIAIFLCLLIRNFSRSHSITRAAQIQTTRLQNAQSGRETTEGVAHPGQFASLPRLYQRRARGQNCQDVCQGTGSEFPLPRIGWHTAHAGHRRQATEQGADCAGERRCAVGLSNARWRDGTASGRRTRLLGVGHVSFFITDYKFNYPPKIRAAFCRLHVKYVQLLCSVAQEENFSQNRCRCSRFFIFNIRFLTFAQITLAIFKSKVQCVRDAWCGGFYCPTTEPKNYDRIRISEARRVWESFLYEVFVPHLENEPQIHRSNTAYILTYSRIRRCITCLKTFLTLTTIPPIYNLWYAILVFAI